MRRTILLPLALVVALSPLAQAGTFVASSKAVFSRVTPARTSVPATSEGCLARVTAYWPGEDYYTNRRRSATGVRLHEGLCAVDPSIIPYGILVEIPGVGKYLAMDTGTAVISRKAARESGHSPAERSALVIDLFFATERAGELFSREGPKFALIAWQSPE
jgi:3D (Asp-Asp-Asp) domain-containing protein